MTALQPALVFQSVDFGYPKTRDRFQIRGFNLELPPGRAHALLGHNGAGKTTLLMLASGFLTPRRGSVTLGPHAADHPVAMRNSGILTADLRFHRRFTAAQVLDIFARLHRLDRPQAAIDEVVSLLRLDGFLDTELRTLSTGMYKRVGLAVVLLGKPPLLLLDEPFAGLDPESVDAVVGALRSHTESGGNALVASHDLPEVEAVATSVSIIEEGRVLVEGPVGRLVEEFTLHPEVVVETEAGSRVLPLRSAKLSAAFGELEAEGRDPKEISTRKVSLGDVYRNVHARAPAPPDLAPPVTEAQRRTGLRGAWVRAAIGVAVLAASYLMLRAEQEGRFAAVSSAYCRADEGHDPGNLHEPDPAYGVNPPAGGPHTVEVAKPGVYLRRERPPDGRVVHALEHGLVAIWVRTGALEPSAVKGLTELAKEFPADVILLERKNMAPPVAATAWGHRLICRRMDLPPLRNFVENRRRRGPELASMGEPTGAIRRV